MEPQRSQKQTNKKTNAWLPSTMTIMNMGFDLVRGVLKAIPSLGITGNLIKVSSTQVPKVLV
jgi:hypothetical protein